MDELNASISGAYQFLRTDSPTGTPPLFSTNTPFDTHTALGRGRLTAPIAESLGIRLTQSGGASWRKYDLGFFGSTTQKAYGVDSLVELFWRDPAIGEINLGYHYGWTKNSVGDVDENGARASAALFLGDDGCAADLVASYGWDRDSASDTHALDIYPRLHLGDSVSLTPVFSWAEIKTGSGFRSFETRTLAGTLELSWLLGAKDAKHVSLSVSAFGGKRRSTEPSFRFFPLPMVTTTQVDRTIYGGSAEIAIYFNSLTSLRQLTRERR